jgi:transposase
MRGDDGICGSLFSYIDLEKRVRADHPLRVIRQIVNAALKSLSGAFAKLYSPIGRESIPPERLMRALLLQAFYSIRSERQLVERIDYDLLFRWFVGLGIEDPVWDATTFTKNRDRLLEGEMAGEFLAAVLSNDKVKGLLSSEHFSVDGTLLEAWASPKSFRPKDGSGEPPGLGRNGEQDFHGERRANDTHRSTTDPDARLYRKGPGKEARLSALFHGSCADGEPQWPGHRRGDDPRLGPCRAAGGTGADRPACRSSAAGHARCRQGLRHRRFRDGAARQGGNPACCPEPERPPLGD